MALTVTAGGTGNSTSSGTTLASVQLGTTFAVGDLLVVVVAADNAGSGGNAANMASPAMTATGFGTISTRQNAWFDNGAASAGAEIAFITAICTTARIATDTITINFASALTSKCCVIWKVTGGAGEVPTFSVAGTITGATSGAPTGTTAASVPVGCAVIGGVSIETNATVTADADTSNGSWSTQATAVANTGTLLTSMRVASQAKVQTTTPSTQTYNPTFTSADMVGGWLVIGIGGTATPSAVALTTTVPAPTVTGEKNGLAAPATIALTVSVPAPTVTGDPIASTCPTVRFNGTTDQITLAQGALSTALFGGNTYAFVVRRNTNGATSYPMISMSSGGSSTVWLIGLGPANNIEFWNGGGTVPASTLTVTSSDGWCIIVLSKASGNHPVRVSKYSLTNGGSWAHEDTVITSFDAFNSPTGGYLQRGADPATSTIDDECGPSAFWTSVLSDADRETMDDYLDSWEALSPVAMWEMGNPVTDTIGAADETGRTSITAGADSPLCWASGGGGGTPCVVTHIAKSQTTSGVSATNTITPTNWTPQANALLVVCVNITINDGGSGATTFSVSDSFSGSSAWTERKTFGGTLDGAATYSHRESIFTMQCGPTPGSHSITVTRTAGNVNQWMWIDVFEVTGHDTTTPVVATAQAGGIGYAFVNASMTADAILGEAPTSALFSTSTFGGTAIDNTVLPYGWTAGTRTVEASFFDLCISAYKIGNGGLPRWALNPGTQAPNGMYAVGIEVAAADPGGFGVREAVGGMSGASTTLDLTVVTAGDSPVLVACLAVGAQSGTDAGATSTATYNGVSMTSLGTRHSKDDVWGYEEIFWLAAPAAGSHTLHFVCTEAHDLLASAFVVGEADQTQPTNVAFNAGSGTAVPSMDLTGTTADSLCIGFTGTGEIVYYSNDPAVAWTNLHINELSAVTNAFIQTQDGTGGTVSFSAQKNTTGWFAYGAVEILPGEVGGGDDGTATPAAIALTVSVPAPTVRGAASTTPAAIALTATTPAPTVRGSAGTTPAAIALTTVMPAPTVGGGGTASPAAIARTVVTPAPTVTGGATVTPAAIARTVVVPAPTATGSGNGTATPATIALTVTVPAPTATGAGTGTATPAAIALTVSVPTPTVRGGASTTPAAITRTVTVPNPTVSGGSSTQPSSIVLTAVVPQPTAIGTKNGTATPATIALAVTVPAPTTRGQGRAQPAAVALVAVVPVPSGSGGARVSPATVAVLVIVPTPSGAPVIYLPYWGARVG